MSGMCVGYFGIQQLLTALLLYNAIATVCSIESVGKRQVQITIPQSSQGTESELTFALPALPDPVVTYVYSHQRQQIDITFKLGEAHLCSHTVPWINGPPAYPSVRTSDNMEAKQSNHDHVEIGGNSGEEADDYYFSPTTPLYIDWNQHEQSNEQLQKCDNDSEYCVQQTRCLESIYRTSSNRCPDKNDVCCPKDSVASESPSTITESRTGFGIETSQNEVVYSQNPTSTTISPAPTLETENEDTASRIGSASTGEDNEIPERLDQEEPNRNQLVDQLESEKSAPGSSMPASTTVPTLETLHIDAATQKETPASKVKVEPLQYLNQEQPKDGEVDNPSGSEQRASVSTIPAPATSPPSPTPNADPINLNGTPLPEGSKTPESLNEEQPDVRAVDDALGSEKQAPDGIPAPEGSDKSALTVNEKERKDQGVVEPPEIENKAPESSMSVPSTISTLQAANPAVANEDKATSSEVGKVQTSSSAEREKNDEQELAERVDGDSNNGSLDS